MMKKDILKTLVILITDITEDNLMIFLNKKRYKNLKGIYIIKNLINGKVYVGSTHVKFSQRYSLHTSRLNRNVHHSPHMQNSWNKYGKNNFEFIVIEILSNDSEINKQEEYWINKLNSVIKGYNITDIISGKRIKKHSSETRKRMNKDKYKKVIQYDLSGNFIKVFDSMDSTKLEGFNPKFISECCNNRIQSHKNYRWRHYSSNYNKKLPYLNNYLKHTVKDLNTNKVYQTMREAALDIGVSPSTIRTWIKEGVKFKKLN